MIIKRCFLANSWLVGMLGLWSGLAWAQQTVDIPAPTTTMLEAEISGMTPFTLGRLNPQLPIDAAANKTLCVYSSGGFYTVTVSDDGVATGFQVENSGAKNRYYQVFWSNTARPTRQFELTAGATSLQITNGTEPCTTMSNKAGFLTNLEVVMRGVELQGARARIYIPNLRITIVPISGGN
jgi:hypothetical protein